MQRSLALTLAVLVAAGIGALYLTGSLDSGPPARSPGGRILTDRPDRSSPTPASSGATVPIGTPFPSESLPAAPAPSGTLTYLRGTRIFSRDIRSGPPRLVVDLHTADVAISTSSGSLAYVLPEGSSVGEGDFVRRPELHLLDMSSGKDADLGVGFSPVWNATGSEFVYLSPTQPRGCDGETCAGAVRVTLAAAGAAPQPISSPGQWHLLAWSGDRVLASEASHAGVTFSLSSTGGPTFAIQIPPNEIWDASPTGSQLISVTSGKISLLELRGGHPVGDAHTIATDAVLGDGTWSSGSELIAAVLIQKGRGGRMALLSGMHAPVPVAGSQGAMGNVVWDLAGDRFAYVSVDGSDRSRLQAVLCRLGSDRSARCKPVFSWAQGVSLLRVTIP